MIGISPGPSLSCLSLYLHLEHANKTVVTMKTSKHKTQALRIARFDYTTEIKTCSDIEQNEI